MPDDLYLRSAGALAGRVEVVDAPDPDAPNRTIRRARRIDPLMELTLLDRHLVAALRFRDDCDRAQGGREGSGQPLVRVTFDGSPAWSREHTTVEQMEALKHRREALQAMGPAYAPIVVGVLVEYRTLSELASGRMDRETAKRRLAKGLDRLVEYYG